MPPVINGIDAQIAALRQGEHLCSVYDATEEMLAHTIPYIKHGLRTGEQCIYVADEHSAETIAESLRAGGVDLESALAQRRLIFWTRREYRQPGEFDLKIMYGFVERTLERGLADGHAGVRLAVEMTWTVNSGVAPEQLVRWEGLINKVSYPGSKVSFLCQYNARLLLPDVIRRAVYVHPVVVLGEQVCPNLDYQPAEQALQDGSDGDLSWLLGRIRSHVLDPPTLTAQTGSLADSPIPAVDLLDQIMASLPLGVYICEAPSGRIKYFNQAAVKIWGRTPRLQDGDGRFCGSWRLYRPDGTPVPHELCPMADVLRQGIVVHNEEVLMERPDGGRRMVLANITPIRNRQGELSGALNLLQDITERKRSEAANAQLVRDLERSKAQLHEKIMDLQKFEDVVVGRELKMMELERENRELRARLHGQ